MASYRETLMRRLEQALDREAWPDEDFELLVEAASAHAGHVQQQDGFWAERIGDEQQLDEIAWAWVEGFVQGWSAAIGIDGEEDDGDDDDEEIDPDPHRSPGRAEG